MGSCVHGNDTSGFIKGGEYFESRNEFQLLKKDSAFELRGFTKSFRTGRLERELQMVQLSATRCSCIAILWASLVSFAAITLCVSSQRMFIFVSIYFVIDSVRKLMDIPS
jgi:hypothetical protein